MSLPAADELFRTTGGAAVQSSAPQQGPPAQVGQVNGETAPPPQGATGGASSSTAPKVPAPSPEPAAESGGGEDTAADESGSHTAPGPAEHAGRQGRGTGKPEAQRATTPPQQAAPAQGERPARRGGGTKNRQAQASSAAPRRGRAARRPSGRERHDEKITVYVSAEELMDLEHARLVLRGEHGLAVDRGRIVREAVAVVLADLESRGDASILVRRLRGR
ncbi:hypothetical protein [Streptomyces reniochalinae]|uniref:Cobyrinic acid a,c-diamide synthase n=1 Tax=Streptomyces reniochalinae TaxID=2250578 RepID=A0A367F5H5_9ACTN|nr:hypothetical protein [Streptomyces reniochalinae]RCG25112.1 hypothetical protein DQ392_00920 [Streptomyces reniochalinae]